MSEELTDQRAKEICRMLEQLGKVWAKYPHQRLGQLLVNCLAVNAPNVFYAPDKSIMSGMESVSRIGFGGVFTDKELDITKKGSE